MLEYISDFVIERSCGFESRRSFGSVVKLADTQRALSDNPFVGNNTHSTVCLEYMANDRKV